MTDRDTDQNVDGSRPLIPGSSAIKRSHREAGREQQLLDEYLGKTERSASQGATRVSASAPSPTGKHTLTQEWDIEDGSGGAPADDDILARLERLEHRLDAFESTCYTFLLYAKQLSDRTVSFFEDIFGLGREDLAQIHDRLGVNYNNKGDYDQAIASFQKLVDLNRTAPACHKLGVAHDNNGDFQEAIDSFRASIDLDAHYLDAYYKLAEVYSRTENFGEAVRCLTQATEVEPENAETHYRLGSVHNARGSYDDAIEAFSRVIELNPAHPGIHQSLGLAYEHKGEHNKAIEFFKKSI